MATGPRNAVDSVEVADAYVSITKLSGEVLVTLAPVPNSILEVKQAVFDSTSIPMALQNLISSNGLTTHEDSEKLDTTQNHSMLLVTSETPMCTWDIDNNPAAAHLQCEGTSVLTCPNLRLDFCTVLTKEPIRSGVHYFEFIMHTIGDEQWCGVTSDPKFAGPMANPRMACACWTYYCGRRCERGSLRDGKGALHAPGHAVAQFKQVGQGDIIGMLVDMEKGALAFDLNGELQGACPVDNDKPLYCLTQPDDERDKIELKKPSLQDAPPANLKALAGALLDITQDGKVLR
mmetsp:Transcript_89257/g.158289  ORF Transcript_89257/g.158289 Transcript_89257/m.158289 type:complete len:290 (-) Transcript_89257:302-1171(-)|eukprot:CAMPEP_0197640570 /NCGR_PEP_ID=MMETSP1338-20131121/14818_1 /TAXON_ID=43686 ORGANISM="Pelagodinium beii, Strain RCC1491" /NCGR_SAMPLE_ID=MMETSP1338 /ASSEMBLY_ACC=CAM_ASM_000754 /LENGTH=289 /DNA_ID=CAMNT_0043213435 /DNA_START=81 /DNA_END=950 /DNA_ORIENTATION=+